MTRAFLCLVAACSGASPPSIANQSTRPDAPAPDRDGFVELLKTHADHSLATASERGCPATETVGVWTARLIENGSPKNDGDRHRLTGGCGAYDPKKMTYIAPPTGNDAETYWYCTVDAYSSDPAGESPWSCGLFARVRKSDRSVDLGSLVCPGTC